MAPKTTEKKPRKPRDLPKVYRAFVVLQKHDIEADLADKIIKALNAEGLI